jgi:hypothetical protein
MMMLEMSDDFTFSIVLSLFLSSGFANPLGNSCSAVASHRGIVTSLFPDSSILHHATRRRVLMRTSYTCCTYGICIPNWTSFMSKEGGGAIDARAIWGFKVRSTRLELLILAIAFHFPLAGTTSSDVVCLGCGEQRVAKLVTCSS